MTVFHELYKSEVWLQLSSCWLIRCKFMRKDVNKYNNMCHCFWYDRNYHKHK